MLDTERMIRRRVAGGYAESQSRELLADLLSTHSDSTLIPALVYHGFLGRNEVLS